MPAGTTGDLSYTAWWSPATYWVDFHANGGTGAMQVQHMIYDDPQLLESNAFTYEGHTFSGWATTRGGSVEYSDGERVENLTAEPGATVDLYAVWAKDGASGMSAFAYDEARDAGTFDPATDGAWTTPDDGALTAVLYDDGDLVFQYGDSTAAGRAVGWTGVINGLTSMSDEEKAKVSSVSSRGHVVLTGQEGRGLFNGMGGLQDVSALKGWDVSGATDLSNMFTLCGSLKSLHGLEGWDTSNVTCLYDTFDSCTSLANFSAIKDWDVSKVTDLAFAFSGLTGANSLDGLESWDTSNVTRMYGTFMGSTSIQDLTALANWNTSNVTDMSYIFDSTTLVKLDGLGGWDVSKVSTFERAFHWCSNLSDISAIGNWKTSGATNMKIMFYGCRSMADVSPLARWDVSHVESVRAMFQDCTRIDATSLNGWNLSPDCDKFDTFANARSYASWY